ncbi:MAG: M23 family metallopeptidase [Chloroflexi bacterium]|nr:M23 family metallopeptidase [Chloroflexota bacterium]
MIDRDKNLDKDDNPGVDPEEVETEPESNTSHRSPELMRIWGSILQLGLGELSVKLGTGLLSITLVLLVAWVMGNFYLNKNITVQAAKETAASPLSVPTPQVSVPLYDMQVQNYFVSGIQRDVLLHTIIPEKPRYEIITYEVQPGDTIIGIAQKFNLAPETIYWGNLYTLADDPHRLSPGQQLNILPVNGVYYEWHEGDGLNGVAEYFGVTPESIINYKGNNLNPDTIGDYANPDIAPGTWLIIEGGKRELINWIAPRITRDDPAVAKTYGPGYCGEVYEGPVGNGTFIWPTVEHYLSGFDYDPSINHYGLDFAGSIGNGIYAVDSGVVVYAGWNDYGYGNLLVIDHGNGWQSYYAHLDTYLVQCGSYVYQGDLIGGMGSTGNSTGPHLHFELRSDVYGRVNPWNFLQ